MSVQLADCFFSIARILVFNESKASLDVESNDLAVLGKQIFQISGAGVWRKSSKEKSHLLSV